MVDIEFNERLNALGLQVPAVMAYEIACMRCDQDTADVMAAADAALDALIRELEKALPCDESVEGDVDEQGQEMTIGTQELVRISECRRKLRSGEARELRIRAHVGLSEVARAAGISRTAAYRYENGERTPRPDEAMRYAEVLDGLQKVVGAEEYHCRC